MMNYSGLVYQRNWSSFWTSHSIQSIMLLQRVLSNNFNLSHQINEGLEFYLIHKSTFLNSSSVTDKSSPTEKLFVSFSLCRHFLVDIDHFYLYFILQRFKSFLLNSYFFSNLTHPLLQNIFCKLKELIRFNIIQKNKALINLDNLTRVIENHVLGLTSQHWSVSSWSEERVNSEEARMIISSPVSPESVFSAGVSDCLIIV